MILYGSFDYFFLLHKFGDTNAAVDTNKKDTNTIKMVKLKLKLKKDNSIKSY